MIRPSPFLAAKERWLYESHHAFIFDNNYPVTKGHVLVIPKREVEHFFDLNSDEWLDIKNLINLYVTDKKAVGFNIGLNSGEIAGQSVAHLHFHIFPHFEGDPGLPKGGCCRVFENLPDYYKSG